MSEELSGTTESIMAEALAAKGVPTGEPSTPSASELIEGPWTAQADGTMRSGAFSSSQTESIMASALAAIGKLPAEHGGEQADVDADAGVETAAIDANPSRTAQAVREFAVNAGLDADLSKFYAGRIQRALTEPAMSPEAQRQACANTHRAMVDYFGDEAEGYAEVARREVARLAKDYPDLPAILTRTNLGNDMHLIKSLIAHAANRELKARGYKV